MVSLRVAALGAAANQPEETFEFEFDLTAGFFNDFRDLNVSFTYNGTTYTITYIYWSAFISPLGRVVRFSGNNVGAGINDLEMDLGDGTYRPFSGTTFRDGHGYGFGQAGGGWSNGTTYTFRIREVGG